jgi:hypothetical protein
MALASVQALTEMSTRNLPAGKGRGRRRPLWADCLQNVGASTSHKLFKDSVDGVKTSVKLSGVRPES